MNCLKIVQEEEEEEQEFKFPTEKVKFKTELCKHWKFGKDLCPYVRIFLSLRIMIQTKLYRLGL
jgi:hypothetical protein